jgi:hypothetical protein
MKMIFKLITDKVINNIEKDKTNQLLKTESIINIYATVKHGRILHV